MATCLPLAHAQTSEKWPAKPITWLVGYAAGGSVDVATRIVARKVEAQLGQPVVVENRPGATGSIALAAAARAPKDGYTIITVPGPVVSSKSVPSFGKELVAVARLAGFARTGWRLHINQLTLCVTLIDEAHGMSQREWLWLVGLHSQLDQQRIRLCVISVASLQFFDEAITMALSGGAHVAARFMLAI